MAMATFVQPIITNSSLIQSHAVNN